MTPRFVDYRELSSVSLTGPYSVDYFSTAFKIDSYQVNLWKDRNSKIKKWWITFPEVTNGEGMIGPFYTRRGSCKFAKSLVVTKFLSETELEKDNKSNV